MSDVRSPAQGDAARSAAEPPLPANLRRNAPLVPTDSAASRALAAVIAILTFPAPDNGRAASLRKSPSRSAQEPGATSRRM